MLYPNMQSKVEFIANLICFSNIFDLEGRVGGHDMGGRVLSRY